MTKIKNKLQEISYYGLKKSGDYDRTNPEGQVNHTEKLGRGVLEYKWGYQAGTKKLSVWGKYGGIKRRDTGEKNPIYPFKIDFLQVKSEEVTDPEELQQIYDFIEKQVDDFKIDQPIIINEDRLLVVTSYDQVLFLEKPTCNETNIQVRCGCPSYRFAYFQGNKNHKASTGANFPTYIPKGGEPKPIIAGACKHLQIIIDELQNEGYIK